MSDVKTVCDQLDHDFSRYDSDISNVNTRIDENMRRATEDRSLWDRFIHWVQQVIAKGQELVGQIREKFDEIGRWIRDDVLPFVFAPFYLDQSGDKYAAVARRTSTLAGTMAAGQIMPAAGWSGVGYDAYETTRGQQEEAAKVTAEGVQMLSGQLHTVATNMVLYWQQLLTGIGSFFADVLSHVGQLLDVKKWTEVLPAILNIASSFMKLILDQLKALTEYILTAIPMMDELNTHVMASNQLAGGDGWPKPAAAMTQPPVAGEPQPWDDGEPGPNTEG